MMKWTFTHELTDNQENEILSNVTTFYNEGLDEVREQFEDFLRGCGYVIDYEENEPLLNEPEENGWISWDGDKRPVSPYTLVDIKYRSGAEEHHIQACSHRWNHIDSEYDIIAYRVSK